MTDKICGHVNKHNYNGNKLEDLACDLPKGHTGDHSAEKHEIHYREGAVVFDGVLRVSWNDAAGTPVENIEEDLMTLPKRARLAAAERKGLTSPVDLERLDLLTQ